VTEPANGQTPLSFSDYVPLGVTLQITMSSKQINVFVPTSPLKTVFISRWNVAGDVHISIGILQNSK